MKKIIKIGALTFCGAALALSMTACGSLGGSVAGSTGNRDAAVALPAQYSITYEVQKPGEDAITLVTKAQDGEGNVYYASGSTEQLFLNDGGRYQLYEKDADGNFSESSSGKLYTADYIKTATADFTACAQPDVNANTPGFDETEGTTVAGRTCTVYENKIGVAGMNTTYVLQLDQETGVCLGYNELTDTGIFTSEPGKAVFSCTEFLTEDVTLPVELPR